MYNCLLFFYLSICNNMRRSERFMGLYAQFDPKLILLQMTSHQILYYCGLTFFYLIFDFSFGLRPHFGQYFDQTIYDWSHSYGMIAVIANFMNMFLIIVGLIFITEKGNKVADFVVTIYLIHCFYLHDLQSIYFFGPFLVCDEWNLYGCYNLSWRIYLPEIRATGNQIV